MKKQRFFLLLTLILYLGQYKGYLALWETGNATPQHVYPYKTSLYPKVEQRVLQDGIPITSREQLAKLLENYLS